MDPGSVIRDTISVYAHCKSMSVSGYATSGDARVSFAADYLAPDKFRFLCQSEKSGVTNVFLISGLVTQAVRWNGDRSVENLDYRQDAISSGAAISFGAINALAELLFTGLSKPVTFGGKAVSLVEEEFSGKQCFVVSTEYHSSKATIWISKADFVVLKIDREIERKAKTARNIEAEIVFATTTFNQLLDGRIFDGEYDGP